MNNWRFISFFTALMGLYAGLHVYAGVRVLDYIPPVSFFREAYVALVVFLFLSYPLGRFLERYWLNRLSSVLVKIGAFWIAAIIYLFIGLVISQMSGLFLRDTRGEMDFLVLGLASLLLLRGNWNATHSKVTRLKLRLDKRVPAFRQTGFVWWWFSDIHMGTIVNRRRVERLVNEINALNPDLVLFPGDVLDEDLGPVIKENLGECLLKIQSPLGVFASTGNHEYIGGVDEGAAYLRNHGVHVLRDQAVLIQNAFYLVGREDVASQRFGGEKGKSLAELLQGLEPAKPVIVLDHSPTRLEEAGKEGVDLVLSGHTHHGQFWPWNLVTRLIYRLSRGYLRIAGTHVVVSNGYGTWGPPVRIGSRSEILLIKLRSKQ